MHRKMKELTHKLKNTTIIPPLMHIYFKTHLTKKVCFRSEIISLLQIKEKEYKKLYKTIIL